VTPVYLKKPRRAAGLIHATLLAILADVMIERELRKSMAAAGIDSLHILPEEKPSKTPTTARILEMFSGVAWYEFERSEETVTFPVKLAPFQVRLLKLLDVDPTAYA